MQFIHVNLQRSVQQYRIESCHEKPRDSFGAALEGYAFVEIMEVLAFDAHFLHTDQMLDSLEIGLTIFDCCALSEDESVHLAALITYDRKGCVSPAK